MSLVLLSALGFAQGEELKVGFGRTDITPPVGAIMTGAELDCSVGADDPLFAASLVAQSGGRTIAIVGVDLVKIRRDLADAAIAEASRRTGIDRDAVIICPSHNHSSPFPHTVVSELTNDWIGYEPTEQAFEHEGYESLAGVNFVSLEGIEMLVDTAVELLDELWKEDGQHRSDP